MPDTSYCNFLVHTIQGMIKCEYFVNCGGIWAREIGKRSDPPVKVPICPAEHFFLTFKVGTWNISGTESCLIELTPLF